VEQYRVFTAAKRKGVVADPLALMPDPAAAVGYAASATPAATCQDMKQHPPTHPLFKKMVADAVLH